MPIYVFGSDAISRIEETTFSQVGLHERRDLQRLLRQHIDVIAPDTLVISEEFGEWSDSRRRIDLLAIDRAANLVVIELKRTEDGGHMELQAIRYAAMVSTMTFEKATEIFGRHLKNTGGSDLNPQNAILEFLGWDEPDQDEFAQDVRIVLASAEFSKELTSSVLWLSNHGVSIRCIRLKPYRLDQRILLDVQQIIPLPEAEEYQVQVREKVQKERQGRTSNADFTRFDVTVENETHRSVWKRNAIFVVCRHLCERGVSPSAIAKLFDWRPTRVWFSVEGTVGPAEFKRLAAEHDQHFDARRWFCEDDQLVHAEARTYAFSNQWGGQYWYNAMNLLRETYSQFKISFAPAP
jgi:hypothetical protein